MEQEKLSIDFMISQVQDLIQNNKVDEAIELCQKTIDLDSDTDLYQLHYYLGQALTRSGQLDTAVDSYGNAIRLNPEFCWSHHGLAITLFKQGKLEEAVASSSQAIQLKSDVAVFYDQLGKALVSKGEINQAIDTYKTAIEINPTLLSAYKALGEIFFKSSQLDEALDSYQKAIKIYPKSYELHDAVGKIQLKKGEIEQAASSYLEATQLNPDSAWSHYNLGYCFKKAGKLDDVVKCDVKALQADPGFAPAYQRLMFTQLRPEQLDEVVEAFKSNIQQKPKASWLSTRLGDLLSKQGRIDDAIEAYKSATYKLNIWLKPEYTAQYWDSGKIKGPDFIIIGAMKAGTTSLYEYISQHPQVLPCAQKEVHFFVHHFEKGLDWYLSHFPPLIKEKKFITGEASPGYFCNSIQESVKSTFPNIKLMAILRNPVDRAVSHYYHNVKHGIEMRSFEEAINAEITVMESISDISTLGETSNWCGEQGYLLTGLYVYFLKKWMSVFPREQFLIVRSEDLYEKPILCMNKVFDFLQLPEDSLKDYKAYLKGYYSPVDQSWRKTLSELFKGHNKVLEDYLGIDFNW